MLEIIKISIKSEAVFSEDKKHRVSLFREWECNRPTAAIIMINPSKSTAVQSDMTTVCILNNLERLNYGGVFILNLYSQINTKIEFRFSPDEELLHPENDSYIIKAAEKASIVVLAWGQIGENNRRVKLRQMELLDKLQPHEHKFHLICDSKGRRGLHPLTPQIRNVWTLEAISLQSWREIYGPKPETEEARKQDLECERKVSEDQKAQSQEATSQ